MQPKIDIYNDFADEYAEMVTKRENAGVEHDPVAIMPEFLNVIGDVTGLTVLDAGCGEGYLSRILADRGAKVTGIDIAPRLIQIARAKDRAGRITFRVADISQGLPDFPNHFDLIASHLVMNDVFDYQNFLRTLGTVAKHGGRLVFTMNNPYSFIIRNHLTNYFDTGKAYPYRGMTKEGVKVHFYQRTFSEYLNDCLSAGFQLQRLVDLPTPEKTLNYHKDKLLPDGYQFPYFMILSFVKP